MPKRKRYLDNGGKSSFVRSLENQPTILEQVAEYRQTKEEENKRKVAAFRQQVESYGEKVANRNRNYLTASNDATYINNGRIKNKHLEQRGIEGAKQHAAWEKEHPNLAAWGNIAAAVPFAIATAPVINALGNAAAASSTGQAITKNLGLLGRAVKANPTIAKALPYLDAGLSSYDTTDGFTKMATRDYSPETILEAAGGYGALLTALDRYIPRKYYLTKELNPNRIKAFRKLSKRYNRLTGNAPSYYYYGRNGKEYRETMNHIAQDIARGKSEVLRYPSASDKEAFKNVYKTFLKQSAVKDVEANMANTGLKEFNVDNVNRLYNIFQRNPEYYIHVKEHNIKNPLSQEAINSFIDRQLTSIRGVSATDRNEAINYLTSTQRGRIRSGGDRLGSKGGLYVSNNPMIADRFKNPVGISIENGYVGILKEPDLIDRNLSIEQQLKTLRNRVEFAGNEEPLYGTNYLDNLDNSNVSMLESKYVGTANRGTGGYERVYLPSNVEGKTEYPVGIKRLDEYLNQVDNNGRCGYGLPASSDKRLFIAKQLNAYDDFVKRARAVMKPHKDYDVNKFYNEYNKLGDEINKRNSKRVELVRKLDSNRFKYNNAKANALTVIKPAIYGSIFGGIGAAGIKMLSDNTYYSDLKKQYKETGKLPDDLEPRIANRIKYSVNRKRTKRYLEEQKGK